MFCFFLVFFFFKQKTAYEMRISDWSSDVCSSDLVVRLCIPCRSGDGLWVAAERLREMRVVLADAHVDGDAPELGAPIDADTALRELMRSRLEDRKSVV